MRERDESGGTPREKARWCEGRKERVRERERERDRGIVCERREGVVSGNETNEGPVAERGGLRVGERRGAGEKRGHGGSERGPVGRASERENA